MLAGTILTSSCASCWLRGRIVRGVAVRGTAIHYKAWGPWGRGLSGVGGLFSVRSFSALGFRSFSLVGQPLGGSPFGWWLVRPPAWCRFCFVLRTWRLCALCLLLFCTPGCFAPFFLRLSLFLYVSAFLALIPSPASSAVSGCPFAVLCVFLLPLPRLAPCRPCVGAALFPVRPLPRLLAARFGPFVALLAGPSRVLLFGEFSCRAYFAPSIFLLLFPSRSRQLS